MAFHKSWLREIMLKHGRPLKQRGRGRKRRQMCAGRRRPVMDVSLFTGINWEGRGAWQRWPERRKGMET